MRRAGAFLVAAALLAGACHKGEQAAPANAAAADATGGWIDRVVATPEGGYRMGNPQARVRLVEYGSYTCPHCAAFAAEAMPGIRQRVAAGSLSFEYRPYAREVFDLTADLVARCAGPAEFFAVSEQIYAAQQEWIGNAQNMTPADQDKIDSLPSDQQFRQLARATGLNGYAGRHGVDPGHLDKCLTDPQAVAAIVGVHDRANTMYSITATPMFLINERLIRSADWKSLAPQLDAATKG